MVTRDQVSIVNVDRAEYLCSILVESEINERVHGGDDNGGLE